MNKKLAGPEICCDLNARMTENGYSLQIRGAIDGLRRRDERRPPLVRFR
jgi:hypothetical protein